MLELENGYNLLFDTSAIKKMSSICWFLLKKTLLTLISSDQYLKRRKKMAMLFLLILINISFLARKILENNGFSRRMAGRQIRPSE